MLRPVSTSHKKTLSFPQLARNVPVGLNETERTEWNRRLPVAPVRVRMLRPVPTSHIRTVLSPPLAKMVPSGLNATDWTAAV